MSCLFLRMALVTLSTGILTLSAFGNPYCVSGANWAPTGVMRRLNMPEECYGYIWDQLQTTNRVNMVRPCNYWLFTNRPHQSYGYHEDTDTIHDPEPFATWIAANPGKIWLIGNEPDLKDQDNLTPAQYAAMFHTYYTFISERDPTAIFAVGAKSGDAHPGNVEHAITWWTQVLNHYRNTHGVAMPVDIWNFHCYAPTYQRDVEEYMTLWVNPFTNFVRTVENGVYADAEIWVTEFGIGFWHGQLNAKWVEPWMQRVCLRLERSEVNRWFWFYGPWDNYSGGGEWQQTCLIGPDGQPTILGQRYGDMARSWPNTEATPMPDPEEQPAPEVFFTDFSDNDVSLWVDKAGPWRADNGTYRCDLQFAWRRWGLSTLPPFRYTDVSLETRVRINNIFDGNTNNWAGVEVGRNNLFEDLRQSGWLVHLRYNGMLGFHSHATGTLLSATDAVTCATEWNTLRLDAGGNPPQYDVYVNGEHKIRWIDMENRFPEGFVTLVSGQTNCSYDWVRITRGSLITPEAINGNFETGLGQEMAPWLPWKDSGGLPSILQVQDGIGREGSRGLRAGSSSPGGPFDTGIRRSVPGARPDTRYAVQAWVRSTTELDPDTWIRVGVDPTGQIEDPNASTVVWVDAPFSCDTYQRIRTPLVTSTTGRLGIWLRVGTRTVLKQLTAYIDDVEILDETRMVGYWTSHINLE